MVTPGMELATRNPEWLSRTRDGRLTSISAAGEVSWLNPFRPEVQKLIQELVVEIVATSGADGIQFDDHMSLPSEFGYDPFTVALYKRETGRMAPADPQEPAWLQWRANKLTAFMAQLHKVVNEQHPGALVSLSPNYHDFAYKRQLQQWREWVRPKPPAPAAWGWRFSISKPSGSAVMSPPSYARGRWGVCFRSRLHAPCRRSEAALPATLPTGRTRGATLRAPALWAHLEPAEGVAGWEHRRSAPAMASPDSDRLAVLIDADNAQPGVVGELLTEVASYGTATVKRAYGDWTTPQLGRWKDVLHVHAIQPVQQFSYTSGKNATDSALIIDAMDLLHSGRVDGFCLVSSDSDFTRLATRIRESGLAVYGFGERKTPKPFVAACDKFIYTEILKRPEVSEALAGSLKPLGPALRAAIAAVDQEDGWAPLGQVGTWLLKHDPSFDPRNFGFKKLSDLVRAQTPLDLKTVPGSQGAHLYVRVREG